MVNKERLADLFDFLVRIDSESKDEAKVCSELKKILESMGAKVVVDDAGKAIGSNTGNLIAKFKGNKDVEPICLCGHMDTVVPGKNIVPTLKNGIFTSDGTTILGADDKSAIAIIIETLKILQENNLSYGPLEIVFTICEEIGLLGAKNFDINLIDSKFGYILDSTDIDGIVTKAPGANCLKLKVIGKAAHAGAEPENGINAISIASKAIAKLELGRIDEETTCNIGKIKGGKAENIVPDLVTVSGEVRSHNKDKLALITDNIVKAFESVVNECQLKNHNENLPALEVSIRSDFRSTNIPEDHKVVTLAKKAAKNLGRNFESKTIGGGADANIFFEKGLVFGVLGTGMMNVHTLDESIKLDDMVKLIELLLEVIKLHYKNG